jgi:hypothetical protein
MKVESLVPKDEPDENGKTVHPAATTNKAKMLQNAHRQLRKEQEAMDGLVPIEGLTGLDIVPNRINSAPPNPISVRPEECWVDHKYQRNISRRSMKLIHDIVTNWDWAKFKPPVLTRDLSNRYVVIDGQHTLIAAATHPDIKAVPAMFVPLSQVQEQAQSFIGHNTARIPVAPLDLFHARITANEDVAVTADKVLREYGITVVRSVQGSGHIWKTNQTVATGIILRILNKYGLPKFVSIVEFVSKCGFAPVRADHWRFAEHLLIGPDRQNQYTPELMIEIIKAANDQDALTEANRIAKSMGLANYQGLLIYYKNRYNETYKHNETGKRR